MRIKLMFACLVTYPAIVLVIMQLGFITFDIPHLISMGIVFVLACGTGLLVKRIDDNVGRWLGERDKSGKNPFRHKWQFIPADLRRYKHEAD